MKTTTKLALFGAVAVGFAAWTLTAQDAGNSPPSGDRPAPRRADGPPEPGRGGPHPRIAIIGALDANHDGVIDADEIKNASAALLTLDKNSDGKLTPDEFVGPRPNRPDGPPPGGPADRPEGRKDARLDDSAGPPQGAAGRPGEFRPPPRGERGPGVRVPALSAVQVLEKFDANQDGKLNESELAAFLKDMQAHRPPPFAGGPPPEEAPAR